MPFVQKQTLLPGITKRRLSLNARNTLIFLNFMKVNGFRIRCQQKKTKT